MPNVEYGNLQQTINDLNIMNHTSTAFQYRTIIKGASNSPEPTQEGTCVFMPFYVTNSAGETQGNYGLQMFYAKNGNIYNRTFNNTYGRHNWGQWERVDNTAGGSSPSGAILRPENENQIGDANVLNYSGIFRTTDSTENLPAGLSSTWGVLQHFYENNGSGNQDAKAGFQLYAPITGSGFGSLYIRVFNAEHRLEGNSTWRKLNISKLIDLQDKVITEPTETLTSVDGTHATGYYYTASNATGMEGIPDGHKDGVLKVIKDEAGGVSIQEYTSSVQGDNDIYVRTIPITSPTSRALSSPFEKIQEADAITKIHDTRGQQVGLPSTYKAQSGQSGSNNGIIYHEWKATSDNGLNLPVQEQGVRCILTTYIPYVRDEEVRNDFSDIVQFAFIKDGRVFKRNGKNGEDTWDTQWTGIGGGGGLTMTDITNMFNSWKTT